jgi:hypothetical protein
MTCLCVSFFSSYFYVCVQRLADVQAELESERSSGDDGVALWVGKVRQLEAQLSAARDRADKADRTHLVRRAGWQSRRERGRYSE